MSKKKLLFNNIDLVNAELDTISKAIPTSAAAFHCEDTWVVNDLPKDRIFKRKSFGCNKTMHVWDFYIEDENISGFEKVFGWITKPYKTQMDKERKELSRLKKDVEFLEQHIRKYLPEHNMGVDIQGDLYWKPKGRKYVK